MRICIIGWYGTETLGDRAILGGIFNIFSKLSNKNQFLIGSLFTFYTERTLLEEESYFRKISESSDIQCFNVKDSKKLSSVICDSDLLIMGGGPLMEMYEMELIRNSFVYAKRMGVKTIVLGCGIDNMLHKTYCQITMDIIKCSDIVILRDNISNDNLKKIAMYIGISYEEEKIFICNDPAFLGINIPVEKINNGYAVINVRDYTYQFNQEMNNNIKESLHNLIDKMIDIYGQIILLPNHTFFLGGDDRYYNAILKHEFKKNSIFTYNYPLGVEDTLKVISGADICIGMRYHAVLFQMYANGNNYIIDYTKPDIGKMSGLLSMIPNRSFYQNRYLNLARWDSDSEFTFNENKYEFPKGYMGTILNRYLDILDN